jgi:hypothetical protein
MKLEIKVNNPALSEAVQLLLFKAGLNWAVNKDQVQYTDSRYLHTWDDGHITHSRDSSIPSLGCLPIDAATEFGKLIDRLAINKPSWKIGCRTVVADGNSLLIKEDNIRVSKSTLEEMLAALK